MEPQPVTGHRPVVILGGGPAAMSAAIALAEAGVRSTLIDENALPGGQIYRRFPDPFRAVDEKALGRTYRSGEKLRKNLTRWASLVEVWTGTNVLVVEKGPSVVWTRDSLAGRLTADQVIVACGAYERPIPFPGWTLPGVMQAGGVQTFLKTFGVRPARRALIAGTGPLLLVVANQLHASGVEVVAVLEAGLPKFSMNALQKVWGEWGLLRDAFDYWWGLKKAGIPLLFNHTIFEARGKERVEEVCYGPVDPSDWRPLKDQSRTLLVDLVVTGFGFIPNTELTVQLGCEHEYREEIGGWVPVLDDKMRTTVPGILAAGDGAGVAGALVAIEEGRVAGITAAETAGALSAAEANQRRASSQKRLKQLSEVRQVLDAMSRPRAGLCELAAPDTLVCRCEEVPVAHLDLAIAQGARDLQSVKLLTRLGMGACQGRNCDPSARMHLCRKLSLPPERLRRINPRFPARPVTLGAMAHLPAQSPIQQLEDQAP